MAIDDKSPDADGEDVLRLSVEIVASYLTNNSVSAAAIPVLIRSVHGSLQEVGRPEAAARPAEKQRLTCTCHS